MKDVNCVPAQEECITRLLPRRYWQISHTNTHEISVPLSATMFINKSFQKIFTTYTKYILATNDVRSHRKFSSGPETFLYTPLVEVIRINNRARIERIPPLTVRQIMQSSVEH